MFVRKLYYSLSTGEVLESYMRLGDVIMTSFDEDVNTLPSLADRTEDNTGCIVWEAPDPVMEEAFANATGVLIDVQATPHQIVFDYTPAPEITDPTAEMEAALNELGVKTRE